MPADIQFSSELTLKVLSNSGEALMFLMHLPEFLWRRISPDNGLDQMIEPVFYIDDDPPYDAPILRGAIEAACEELWCIYSDVVESGFPGQVIRHMLPANLMQWGTVTFTEGQVKDFVSNNCTSPIKELALVAHGFERALTDGHEQR